MFWKMVSYQYVLLFLLCQAAQSRNSKSCVKVSNAPSYQSWCNGLYSLTSEKIEGELLYKNEDPGEHARFLYWSSRFGGQWQISALHKNIVDPSWKSAYFTNVDKTLPSVNGNFGKPNGDWQLAQSSKIEYVDCGTPVQSHKVCECQGTNGWGESCLPQGETWDADGNWCYFKGGLEAKMCPGAKLSRAGDRYWSEQPCMRTPELSISSGGKIKVHAYSLTSTWNAVTPASNCFDGNANTMCHGKKSSGDTLTAEIPRADVTRVRIYNRKECCQGRIANAVVRVDGQSCGVVQSTAAVIDVTCSRPLTGTIVTLKTKEYLNIMEFEIFGTASTATNGVPTTQFPKCSKQQNEVNLGIETMDASLVTYNSPEKGQILKGGWQIKNVMEGSFGGGWKAFLAQNANRNNDCMVSFRGSVSVENYVATNFNLQAQEDDNHQMHMGFYDITEVAVRKLKRQGILGFRTKTDRYTGECGGSCRAGYEEVSRIIGSCWWRISRKPICEKKVYRQGICDDKNIILTGHSLGAAMSQVLSWALLYGKFDLKKRSSKNVLTYTFGQPKVFMKENSYGGLKKEDCPEKISEESEKGRNVRYILTTGEGRVDETGKEVDPVPMLDVKTFANLLLGGGITGLFKQHIPAFCAKPVTVKVRGSLKPCRNSKRNAQTTDLGPQCDVGVKSWKHEAIDFPETAGNNNGLPEILNPRVIEELFGAAKNNELHNVNLYRAALEANKEGSCNPYFPW